MKQKRKNMILFFSLFFALSIVFSFTSITATAESKIDMVDMHEEDYDEYYYVEDGITDSYGNTYPGKNVLKFCGGDQSFAKFRLDGEYKSFSGKIVASTQTGSETEINVGIFADGRLVYELKSFTKQKPAQDFNIDLTGINTLEIKTSKNSGGSSYVYFVNSSFTKADNTELTTDWSSLYDVFVVDSKAFSNSNRLFVDSFGNLHDSYCNFTCGDEGFALYNLDKKYVSFSGCIVAGTNTGSEATMNISFYVDDQLVLEKTGITKQTPQIDFNVDVSNGSVLKIVTSKEKGSSSYLYVTDSILKPHEHKLGDWEIEKEASCTETGKRVQKCTECGETIKEESIPATGHTPDSKWTIIKEPTCTESGEQVQNCKVCGNPANTETIDPTGHTPSGKWEYLEEGKCKKVQFCTVCGDVALEQTDSEIEHTPSGEWVITKEATCDHEGERVQYCKICGELTSIEVIPTTEHDYGKWETKSGSIWNNPIVKERTCSICGDVEHVESSPTSWLKPLVIVLFIIIFGGLAVILVTLKMNGLPLEPASVKKLFSKETLSDTDIENLLNKPDNKNHKN